MEKEEENKKITVIEIIRFHVLSRHKKNGSFSNSEEIEYELLKTKAEANEITLIE
jgi:hypothetical protein